MLHVFLQPNLSRKLNHLFCTAPVLPTVPFGQSAEDPTPADTESIPRDHGPNLSPLFPFLFALSQNFYQTPHLHMTSTDLVLPKKSLFSSTRCPVPKPQNYSDSTITAHTQQPLHSPSSPSLRSSFFLLTDKRPA
jgi:hypothetical protein